MLRVWISIMIGLGVTVALTGRAQVAAPSATDTVTKMTDATAKVTETTAKVTDTIAKKVEQTKPLTSAQKESARLGAIAAWADKTKASREQVQAAIFAPIIAGNQTDIEYNREAAASIGKKAEAAAKAGDENARKRFRTVAELFTECGNENRRFLGCYKNGDMKGVRDALIRLRTYDARIAEIVGQTVPRSWYAHDIMVATLGMTDAEIKQWGAQQSSGRTPQAAPAARAQK